MSGDYVYYCYWCQMSKICRPDEDPGRCRCGAEWEHVGYEEEA